MPGPAVGDAEGPRAPAGLPPIVDAHVHVFPPRLFAAIWRWFERYGWPIRYRLEAPDVVRFLLDRGVARLVLLHYAHKPGIARAMNRFVAELAAGDERLIGLATVYPGEPDAPAILAEAFAAGLRGVKLHCHVQALAPDDEALGPVYETAAAHRLPVVIHAGRQPRSPHYAVDTFEICAAERVERVLAAHPRLALCVPHLGADEYGAYERLLERHDNLWLDTTMVLADYFPGAVPRRLLTCRPDRILYGTDFPNLPFAWDRELHKILALDLGDEGLEAVLGANALRLYGG
jgi:predicted TIM-barrel fold metal-dependent hydrolase